jgi:hypothetical protein
VALLFFLEVALSIQKATSKLLNNAFYATLCCQIKKLPWSDPTLNLRLLQTNDRRVRPAQDLQCASLEHFDVSRILETWKFPVLT